jgi:ABC-2 type transport system ATP-binding protein
VVEPIIEIKELTKNYGEVRAVDSLSLSIYRGEVFGLLGPNGAGKSTTILMMLGLSEPTSGTVSVCGFDSTRSPIDVKKKVGYLPDSVGFYEDLTGLENLIYTGKLNGFSNEEARERAIELLAQVGLEEAVDKKAGKYSRGMKQRLGLADVLLKKPEVIILDEPTLGIDPKGVQELLELIQMLSKEHNITVLLSSHHLHQVQQICDRVGLFVKGHLLACGDIKQLASEMFSDEPITVKIRVSEITSELCYSLQSIDHVQQVIQQADNSTILLKSKTVTLDKIAKVILAADVSLMELTVKEHGLDEIYHRYFQGGEEDATNKT